MTKKSSKQPSYHLWAVLMAGGAGTRFWPESREANPKQFIPLFGTKTLFEQTLDRVSPVVPKRRAVILTQKKYTGKVLKLGRLAPWQVIGEPVGRNTAPCVALAARMILEKDPKAVMAILPSDNQVGKTALFQKMLRAAGECAWETGMPVTFGLKPAFPHTGYGYLEKAALYEKRQGIKIFRLKRFHEKPSLHKAKQFLAAGNFLWNGGMFIWRADKLMEAVRRYLPEAAELADRIVQAPGQLEKLYPRMPSISVDYGLMEKMAGKILTIPADIDWSDRGGWLSMADLWPKDADGNALKGNVLAVKSRGNIVKADKRLVAVLGLQDFVVVDTPDALLVCPKNQAESIREIVAALKEKKINRYL